MVKKNVLDKWYGISDHPSNSVAPLIKFQRQVTMSPYPLRVIGIHDSFTTWTKSKICFQIRLSRLCYPSNLENKQDNQKNTNNVLKGKPSSVKRETLIK